MKLSSVIIVLATLFAAGARASDGLVLRIKQTNSLSDSVGCYVDGARIPIQLEIANEGDVTATVQILDHDEQGNRKAYPDGLMIRMVDGSGDVLTTHEIDLGDDQREWWT